MPRNTLSGTIQSRCQGFTTIAPPSYGEGSHEIGNKKAAPGGAA